MLNQWCEIYLRDVNGGTRHASIHDAINEFLSDDGYRLSIDIDGVVITLRKGMCVDKDMHWLDEQLTGQQSVDCAVTIRTK